MAPSTASGPGMEPRNSRKPSFSTAAYTRASARHSSFGDATSATTVRKEGGSAEESPAILLASSHERPRTGRIRRTTDGGGAPPSTVRIRAATSTHTAPHQGRAGGATAANRRTQATVSASRSGPVAAASTSPQAVVRRMVASSSLDPADRTRGHAVASAPRRYGSGALAPPVSWWANAMMFSISKVPAAARASAVPDAGSYPASTRSCHRTVSRMARSASAIPGAPLSPSA